MSYYLIVVQTISLKLPDDLAADLEREAKARKVTKSAVVQEGLRKVLRKRPGRSVVSCFDLAQDLAGSVEGLPTDIATNPRYLDDFGK